MSTSNKKVFSCPFCDKKYVGPSDNPSGAKLALYKHMEDEHKEMLGGLSPAQVYFNMKYNKTHGSCVICKKETEWNESTERYNRFCSEECKKKYRKQFQERMKKAGKENQMNDPEHQKKMLANRRISGVYKWSDGKSETPYTGSYEKEFLEFLDLVMRFEPDDVFGPAPQYFEYEYEGKKHFYIPDFYIASLNLLIEIKDGEENPNKHHKITEVDKVKEQLKDEVMLKQNKYDYVKVMDKNYSTFMNFLLDKKFNS